MKRVTIFLALFVFICSVTVAQNGKVAVIYKGKLLFVNSIPIQDYLVVGKAKYSNSKTNEKMTVGDVSGMAKVIVALDKVNEDIKKGKQDDYDAAIIYSPIKIELVKFNTDVSQYQLCNVGEKGYSKKCGTKIMYFMTSPISEYDTVKDIDVQNFTNLGQMKMGKNDIDNFLNKLYERSCKENKKTGVDFDAIMYTDKDIVNDRGFLSLKTISLIKFK